MERAQRIEEPSRACGLVIAVAGVILGALAIARYATFHNETFDLAFYTRMAWGLAEGRTWDPITNTHVLGLHLAPILVPLGWTGRLVGTAPTLLLAQAVAGAMAAWSLARLGRRRLGPMGAWLGAGCLLLHPNLAHVFTYEFHPGNLALWPLARAFERLDARDARGVVLSCLGALACREDLALVTAGIGLLMMHGGFRRSGAILVVLSVVWLTLFVAVLHPSFASAGGSFGQHLGHWGESVPGVLLNWLRHPGVLLEHVLAGRRGTYILRVLLPLALMPLAAPRVALVALPILAINLVSTFPTTANLDSHYLTPAMPALAAATIHGAARLQRPLLAAVVGGVALSVSYSVAGLTSVSPFLTDASTREARLILAHIGPNESVQAPDRLLPHVAERALVFRSGPDRNADTVVLDLAHRRRYEGRGTLLRTQEEPRVRDWLARDDYGVVAREGELLLMRRGTDPRDTPFLLGENAAGVGTQLTDCLALVGESEGWLRFVAAGPCPNDLALRFGDGRVELLFDGQFSPVHLRAGDLVRSWHPRGRSVRVIRSSGAPAEPGDPLVPIPGR